MKELLDEKSEVPPIPRDGGLVTNDWCIITDDDDNYQPFFDTL